MQRHRPFSDFRSAIKENGMPGSLTRVSRFARIAILVTLFGLLVSGCGINTIPTYEEQAKAKWSDVQNQY
jgi:hypothetical protein